MARESSVKSKIYISAGQPATWDSTGYAAVTWTKIGLLGSIGNITGKWDEESFNLLETGSKVKAKTFKDHGAPQITILADESDAGQVILKAGYEDATGEYSIKIEAPSGKLKYFQCKVMDYDEQGNDGAFLKIQSTLTIQEDPDGNGIVRVTP